VFALTSHSRIASQLALAICCVALSTQISAQEKTAVTPANAVSYANRFDRALGNVFTEREKDWRNGAVVYQVIVDRFAPSANLEAKKALYPAPKVLHPWTATPKRGTYREDVKVWSHEIDFWGGDLQSLRGKLDYVKSLGADVLYLNPIHLGYTNHKYDALDYNVVSPEYGNREDVKALARDVQQRGMKLVLDGVFNHMGRNAAIYKEAETNPKSAYRSWFDFNPKYEGGVRAWYNAQNLPEINLENPKVRDHIYAAENSVVRSYLRDGIDGWRLDVAFDIGFKYLEELTKAAHQQKPGSLIVGEIANYPKEWFPSVDGVMNFTLRDLIHSTVHGRIEAQSASRMIDRMIDDAGIDNMLKSWTFLDNHDTDRLATTQPEQNRRRLAQVLQFTLPGSANLYYGSELDMTGGEDPEMRAPMRWDLVTNSNPSLQWTKQLIALRKQHRALRVGNFRPVSADKLLAFERYTDRAEDTVVVIANPSANEISETVMVANSKLMNGGMMQDAFALLTGEGSVAKSTEKPLAIPAMAGLLRVTVPAHGFLVLKPETKPAGAYSSYKRVQ
jgi:cyclomaltodextrinase / maltogenic alpha-amylase / neopullulanase